MKIELSNEQINLILDGLNALSEGAECEKKCTNDPEILESDDAVIQDTEILYRNLASQVSVACRDCIEKAIEKNYTGTRLDASAAVKDTLSEFSKEQVAKILADTVTAVPWDMRCSRSNREWAESIPFGHTSGKRILVRSHPGLTDLFITAFQQAD